MNKIYRCVDCLEEFCFDYNYLGIKFDTSNPESEENLQLLKNYSKNLNFQMKINICQKCLKHTNINSNSSRDIQREVNINIKKVCQEKIEELKNKKESDEDYTEEKEKMFRE